MAPQERESPPLASVEVEPGIPPNVGDEDLPRVNATIDAFDILVAVSMRVTTRIVHTPNRRARDTKTRVLFIRVF